MYTQSFDIVLVGRYHKDRKGTVDDAQGRRLLIVTHVH